jgi:hypothetical protein
MNQFLDIAKEAYSGLATLSRLAFAPHRRIVQRMSAGPALYGPTVILLQNANLAVVADQSSKVCRDESINARRFSEEVATRTAADTPLRRQQGS